MRSSSVTINVPGVAQPVRCSLPIGSELESLKAHVSASTGVAIAELRCARTGALVTSGADLMEPEDALTALPSSPPSPLTTPEDDPSPLLPASHVSELVSLARLGPEHLLVVGAGGSGMSGSGIGAETTVIAVAVRPEAARVSPGLSVGRRYTLTLGHTVYAPASKGDTQLPASDALQSEWAACTGAVGAHANIAALHAHWAAPPPAEALPLLPESVRRGLSATGVGARLSCLLSEGTVELPPRANANSGSPGWGLPFRSVFPFTLDALRALEHLSSVRVAHCAISPSTLALAPSAAHPERAGASAAGASASGRLLLTRFSSAIAFRAGAGAISTAASAAASMALVVKSPTDASAKTLCALAASSYADFVAPELLAAARLFTATADGSSAGTAAAAALTQPGGCGIVVPCAKADVWSLAATILTLALGRHPIVTYPAAAVAAPRVRPSSSAMDIESSGGGSVGAMIGPLLVPSSFVPPVDLSFVSALPLDYPPAFGRLLMWMLRANPAQRICVSAALARVEGLAIGQPMIATPFLAIAPGSGGPSTHSTGIPPEGPALAMGGATAAALSDSTGLLHVSAFARKGGAPMSRVARGGGSGGAGGDSKMHDEEMEGTLMEDTVGGGDEGGVLLVDGEGGGREGKDGEEGGSGAWGEEEEDAGATAEDISAAHAIDRGSWVAIVNAATAGAALAARAAGSAKLPYVPVAAVCFNTSDSDTVAVVASRAAELLGGCLHAARNAPVPSLLDHRGRRLDPLAPFHRLPHRLLKAGASLRLTFEAAHVLPTVAVLGYGIAQAPPPPNSAPAAFVPYSSVPLLAAPAAANAQPLAGFGGVVGPALNRAPSVGAPGVGSSVTAILPVAGGVAPVDAIASSGADTMMVATAPSAPVQAPLQMQPTYGGLAGIVASYQPGCAQPPSSAGVRGEPLLPGYTFAPVYKSDSLQLSENATTVSTRAQWGSVLLAQGRVGLEPHMQHRFSVAFTVTSMDAGAGLAIGMVDPTRFDARCHVFGNQVGSWGYSRTGKISDGSPIGWVEYGESFGAGDTITLEIVVGLLPFVTEPRLRFFKNGVPQGVAFKGPDLVKREDGTPICLVPAVCLGSASGGKAVRVVAGHSDVREFDHDSAHHRIQFSDDCTTVWNGGKWATVLVAHPGLRTGKLTWSVRLDDTRHGAGVAVGIVDATAFHWDKQNLGASMNSWCFSKTGKKGDGTGFHEYGKPYTNGDTITMVLDMDACTVAFAINGESQGTAYTSANGIGTCPLLPAVCLGSTEGSKMAKVSIVGAYPHFRRFNRFASSRKVTLRDLYTVAETSDKWGTVFLDHPGIKTGRFSFGITVTTAGSGCGAGVGFANLDTFDPAIRNLGAADGSWCFSKTGKFSSKSFEAYGSPFKTGDVVTAEVDMDSEVMRFYVNGLPQGDRKVEGIRGLTLVPAVVLGSGDGGHHTQLTIGLPAVTRFDPRRQHKQMVLKDDDRTSSTESRWCSVLADHPGVVPPGVLRFAVKLDGDGGAAIGFAEATSFRPYAQNLGASPNTWAISKTGKVSSGGPEAFQPFSEKFGPGDVIGAEADLNEGILRFWKNGVLLGTAFSGLLGSVGLAGGLCLVPAVCLGSNLGGKASSATLLPFEDRWVP